MTEHRPECADHGVIPHYIDCICEALRACEKRVTAYERSWENAVIIARAGHKDGYTAAIKDARTEAALAMLAIDTYLPPEEHNAVLAAIDALLEEHQ